MALQSVVVVPEVATFGTLRGASSPSCKIRGNYAVRQSYTPVRACPLQTAASCKGQALIPKQSTAFVYSEGLRILKWHFKHEPNVSSRRRGLRVCCRAVSERQATASDPDNEERTLTPEHPGQELLRAEDLWGEIAKIAIPAGLALVADPAASLLDTYFLGSLGSTSLAAVGVSISIFNMVAKLLNVPLLNMTTSFVAEAGAQSAAEAAELATHPAVSMDIQTANWIGQYSDFAEAMQVEATVDCDDDDLECLLEQAELAKARARQEAQLRRMAGLPADGEAALPQRPQKPVNKAVSAALILGTAVGIVEALILAFASGPILGVMGVPAVSDMRGPAQRYLCLRAVGAPALVLGLAIQGAFRGFGDTRTPLFCTVLGNLVNVALLPVFMFQLKLGIAGAAIATVVSQYIVAATLIVRMGQRVRLLPDKLSDLSFNRFLKAGGLLLGRTLSVLFTMTLATSMAARLGTASMAAHQICIQVWLAASLLSDALALAGQTILARAFAQKDSALVKEAAQRILLLGGVLGVAMAGVFVVGRQAVPRMFSQDPGVLLVVASVMPFVVLTQPVNALAFIWDGLLYGASDFAYSAYSMPEGMRFSALAQLEGMTEFLDVVNPFEAEQSTAGQAEFRQDQERGRKVTEKRRRKEAADAAAAKARLQRQLQRKAEDDAAATPDAAAEAGSRKKRGNQGEASRL